MTTFDIIQKKIAEKLGKSIDDVKPESEIVKDLGADSLDLVEMLFDFEEEFKITISDDDSSKIVTIQDIVDIIDKK